MLNIKVADKSLDLTPGTQIQRERSSPFFLSKESGKDGIPGEVSYPFTLPLSPANMRTLGFSDFLPSIRPKQFDILLLDEVNQVSAGKMQMRNTEMSLNQNAVGKQEVNLLCNSSAFAKLIEGKKLKDLQLGGPRTFAWDGFNATTGTGFWRHCHATWDYENCDDGDYVFFPVHNLEFGGYSLGNNCLTYTAGSPGTLQLQQKENVCSITPHIYISYILRCCFTEFGYTLQGDLLEDTMFKKLCMLSFRGVYWSELSLYKNIFISPFYIPEPFDEITIRLSEHVPPDVGIGEFLVELMKFLPIGFDINDGSRTCTIRTLGKPVAPESLKNLTGKVVPEVNLTQNESEKNIKKYGIRRQFNTDSTNGGVADLTNINYLPGREQAWLPLPAPVLSGEAFRVVNDAGYWAKEKIEDVYTEVRLGDATGSYEPEDATDYIESNMAPVSTREVPTGIDDYAGVYHMPVCFVEGNWQGKPTLSTWGMHIAFYQGKNYPLNNSLALTAPYATNTNNKWVVGSTKPIPEIDGTWSMAYELGGYGMVEVWWKEWLKILAERETLKGTLNLDIVEYLNLRWSDELLIENTSYIIKKINEILPYPGKAEVELVRWIKGNT